MATIVTSVKERLRSRSRYRHVTRGRSIEETRPSLPSVAINGWQQTAGYDLPKSLRQTALGEPSPNTELVESPLDKALPEIQRGRGLGIDPTMLAHTLGNPYPSVESLQVQAPASPKPVPDRVSSLRRTDRPLSSEIRGHRRMASEPVPPSYSNASAPPEISHLRIQSKHIPIASTSPQLGQYEAEIFARERSRASNESRSPPFGAAQIYIPIPNTSPQHGQYVAGLPPREESRPVPQNTKAVNRSPRFPSRKDSLEHAERPCGRVPCHRTGRSLDLAPDDPSPYLTRFDDRERELLATAGTRKALNIPDDISIPKDFKLESYTKTKVSTDWAPATTQEVVHRQKTEIVQKAITRDIHVHHYYEYFQPIKVVEILPARHWFIDPKTGKKIEIPEPTGWQMPANMRPTKPDTSTVRKKSRHYLVNEEHPGGVEEPDPELFDPQGNQRLSVSSAAAAVAA